jgi:hypothetical protein
MYVESTIPSYATARPSKELIAAARQAMTRDFWEQERHKFDLCVSQAVLDECGDGDPVAACRRLALLEGIRILPETEEANKLAAIYKNLLNIPERAKADCDHLAICVLGHINYLLTWNCTHLGLASYLKILEYNGNHGLWTPLLVTPETIHSFELEEV